MPCDRKKTEYEVLGYLGKGGYGQISKVRRLSDGKILAMKKIDLSELSVQMRRYMDTEVRLHPSLDHPFIVRMESWEDDKEENCRLIYMELCEGGDLFEYIEKHRLAKTPISEDDIWRFFAQLVDALAYCHDPELRGNGDFPLPIIHRDFKPENIFLNKDQTEVRLGDFGFAKELVDGEDALSCVGTPSYMCPEIIRKEAYNQGAVSYCPGATLYEMCALDFLVDGHGDNNVIVAKVLAGADPTIPKHYSSDLSELVRRLTLPNPLDRPTINEMKSTSGYKWGKAVHRTTTAIESAEQKSKVDTLRKAAVKAEIKANTFQGRINDLELQLGQAKGDNMERSAALDAREELLNQREERIKTQQEQLAIAQQSLQNREQQLLQERLFMNKAQSLKREDLACREEKLAGREHSLAQNSEAITQQSSSQSDSVGVKLATSPSVCISASSTSKAESTCAIKESTFIMNEVRIQHVASPKLRRVARRENLRADITPFPIAATSGIPIRTKHSCTPNQQIRSEGDLYAITLHNSAKSNIPISLARIQRHKKATAIEPREALALKAKTTIEKTKAEPRKVPVAPFVCLPATTAPWYQLRSATANALKGVARMRL